MQEKEEKEGRGHVASCSNDMGSVGARGVFSDTNWLPLSDLSGQSTPPPQLSISNSLSLSKGRFTWDPPKPLSLLSKGCFLWLLLLPPAPAAPSLAPLKPVSLSLSLSTLSTLSLSMHVTSSLYTRVTPFPPTNLDFVPPWPYTHTHTPFHMSLEPSRVCFASSRLRLTTLFLFIERLHRGRNISGIWMKLHDLASLSLDCCSSRYGPQRRDSDEWLSRWL